MTVVISFLKAEDWQMANWAYRQLALDVVAQSPEDKELEFIMQQGDALGLLSIDRLEPHEAEKVLRAIRKVATETIEYKTPGWSGTRPDDFKGHKMYLGALAELLELINIEIE